MSRELMPATTEKLREQQRTIDALVAALEGVREAVDDESYIVNRNMDHILEKIDAALALARKGGG